LRSRIYTAEKNTHRFIINLQIRRSDKETHSRAGVSLNVPKNLFDCCNKRNKTLSDEAKFMSHH
jgi:hypothetical protein